MTRPTYGIVDTTFANINMGNIAEDTLRNQHNLPPENIERITVPGFKDLAVQCKKLIEERGCNIVIACGMPGPEPIDKQCAHEASQGLMLAQLLTNTPILEVFVHMDETDDPQEFQAITQNRVSEHATNAYWLLEAPHELQKRAGTGQRQGFQDIGPLQTDPTTPS